MKIKINHNDYDSSYFLVAENKVQFGKNNAYGIEVFEFLNVWFSSSEKIEIKTSGSTGKPKSYLVEKWKLEASAKRTLTFFNLKKESTFLLCLPLNFIAGKLMVIRSILNEGNLITQVPTSAPLTKISFPIHFGAATPMQLESSIDKYGLKNLCEINYLLLGGSKVSKNLMEKLSGFKGKLFETFGMTETLTHFALRACYPQNEKAFKVLADIELNTKNDRLVVKSKSFLEETIETNDLVELIDNSSFIWKGRADFTINSGGIKIQPENVEQKLVDVLNFPFFISRKKDNLLGEKVVLCILKNDSQKFKPESLSVLEKFEKPKSIIELAEFPLAENGKILRQELAKKIETLLERPI